MRPWASPSSATRRLRLNLIDVNELRPLAIWPNPDRAIVKSAFEIRVRRKQAKFFIYSYIYELKRFIRHQIVQHGDRANA